MAIQINFPDLNWGDFFYLKADDEQLKHELVGIVIKPGSVNKKGERGVAVEFELDFMGEPVIVKEFQATKEFDELKDIKQQGKKDDNDD
jgi:hypothetical protein